MIVQVAGWYFNVPTGRWRFGALVDCPDGSGFVLSFYD